MKRYYIIGKHCNGKHGILCIMDGKDGDDALAKARRIYGCMYAYGFQPVE